MPWLSWKIGDSSKKAAWKIGIVETAALRWALRRTSTFLEFNMVPGYVRRRKGRGKGKRRGIPLFLPFSLPSPPLSFHLSRRLVGRPKYLYPPHDALHFTIFRATVMQSRDSRCIFHCTFACDTCPITFSFFPDAFPLFTVHGAKLVSYSSFCNTITERRRQQTQQSTSR